MWHSFSRPSFRLRFLVRQYMDNAPTGVTLVRTEAAAQKVLRLLNSADIKSRYHACDTEVANIDVKKQSPVGHGEVICASIYCGKDLDFGNGPNIWIDNLGDAKMLHLFKQYFEDEKILKVWHNVSFDRHVMYNMGIDVRGFGGDTMHMARLWNSSRMSYALDSLSMDIVPGFVKTSMKERFGVRSILRSGEEGKQVSLPPVEEIQLDPLKRTEWIEYSTLDAAATWHLREVLEQNLKKMQWLGENMTMMDFYKEHYIPFAMLLTDMERRGMHVDGWDKLNLMANAAQEDQANFEIQFRAWAQKYTGDGAGFMNVSSAAQLRHFFFAPKGEVKSFKADNTHEVMFPGDTKPRRQIPFNLIGQGMKSTKKTPTGAAAAGTDILKQLCGIDPDGKCPLVEHFGKEQGDEAIQAVKALTNISAIQKNLNAFILPLDSLRDSEGRIHCSLGLNTETGRLSSRKPNLQNQPSHEKDKYKVRDVFSAAPGKLLVVADYSQLELRILAHMTKCKSMLEAFEKGGDFHSRTALGMFPYIREDMDKGGVLLEWPSSKGPPPAPLIKNKYSAERGKAKTLNFSICYGKTAFGLMKDWRVSKEEAQRIINMWYADRPEVLLKQNFWKGFAQAHNCSRTMLGRYRHYGEVSKMTWQEQQRVFRASINTPIQGSAADVVMLAMVKLDRNPRLRELGWYQVLQVHDELICEGPEESAKEALSIIRECMEHPMAKDLLVELPVDAKIGKTWYQAK